MHCIEVYYLVSNIVSKYISLLSNIETKYIN